MASKVWTFCVSDINSPLWMRTWMRYLFTDECFDKLKTHQLYFETTCWKIGHERIPHTHKQTKVLSCSMAACAFLEKKQKAFQTLHAQCFVNYLSTFWIWFQRPRHFIENTVIAVFIAVAIGVTVGHAVGVTTVGYCGDKLCSWERTDELTKRNVTVES